MNQQDLTVINQTFCTKKLNFLFLNQNICCGYSKEPSQWDGSFKRPKNILKLIGNIYTFTLIFFLSKHLIKGTIYKYWQRFVASFCGLLLYTCTCYLDLSSSQQDLKLLLKKDVILLLVSGSNHQINEYSCLSPKLMISPPPPPPQPLKHIQTLRLLIETKYHLLYPLPVILKFLCSKQCGPRSDCSSKNSLILVHTVCLYAEISPWRKHLHAAEDFISLNTHSILDYMFWSIN